MSAQLGAQPWHFDIALRRRAGSASRCRSCSVIKCLMAAISCPYQKTTLFSAGHSVPWRSPTRNITVCGETATTGQPRRRYGLRLWTSRRLRRCAFAWVTSQVVLRGRGQYGGHTQSRTVEDEVREIRLTDCVKLVHIPAGDGSSGHSRACMFSAIANIRQLQPRTRHLNVNRSNFSTAHARSHPHLM